MLKILRALIRFYQLTISPLLAALGGPGSGCRFEPTCSHYFLEATETHGVSSGGWLDLKCLARRHPWCGPGHDPVHKQLCAQRNAQSLGRKLQAVPNLW